jgi:hypothetical protein
MGRHVIEVTFIGMTSLAQHVHILLFNRVRMGIMAIDTGHITFPMSTHLPIGKCFQMAFTTSFCGIFCEHDLTGVIGTVWSQIVAARTGNTFFHKIACGRIEASGMAAQAVTRLSLLLPIMLECRIVQRLCVVTFLPGDDGILVTFKTVTGRAYFITEGFRLTRCNGDEA